MGKRLRRNRDLLSGQIGILLILCISFLLGGIAGCIFPKCIRGDSGAMLTRYLTDYLSLAAGGGVACDVLATLWGQFRYLIVILIFGSTVLGVVAIPITFMIKGFFFTFCVGCLVRVFGVAGLVTALLLFGVSAFFWAPALFLIGCSSLSSSRGLLGTGVGRGRFATVFPSAQLRHIALACALLLCACGVECIVVPRLLPLAAKILF